MLQYDIIDTPSDLAKIIMNIIDDHNIVVGLISTNSYFTPDGHFFTGGAFLGNHQVNDKDGNTTQITTQVINPVILSNMDKVLGINGQHILHEITESYQGAVMSITQGIREVNINSREYIDIYTKSHLMATPQYEPFLRKTYDKTGKETNKANQRHSIVVYAQKANGQVIIVMSTNNDELLLMKQNL